MSLKIRKLFEPRRTIAYAIEDPATGLFYDFKTGSFDHDPAGAVQELKEDWMAGDSLRFLRGAYANVSPSDPGVVQLETPRDVFRPGLYIIYYIDRGDVDRAIAIEGWFAEDVNRTIEFRPQNANPLEQGQAPGQAINFNLPPNFTLDGDLSLSIDLRDLSDPFLAAMSQGKPAKQSQLEKTPEAAEPSRPAAANASVPAPARPASGQAARPTASPRRPPTRR
jgi:hypothetical protein